ncbi:hypothetical protein PR003_g32772 [Phytophthora rubi]|uniref:RxLR effector protein n=1 Tax=Phytophthora rubi TaxID=129364 RepID=A0A6A4AXL8_9STRA|nr:hypothetical protein PR002_g31454 [Phytophthora rubi]KAE9264532.1 hypothetical protein PR003_g32772 [Phytophthora rubi]
MFNNAKIFVLCVAAVALSSGVRRARGLVGVGIPGVASVGVGGLGVYGPGVYGPGVYGPGVYGPGVGYNGAAPAYPSANRGATASASATANAYRKLRSEEE